MAPPADDRNRQSGDWIELVVTLILVFAAVATSWSGYQAARWHGEQAAGTNRTGAIRFEAARAAGRADAQTEIDVATFIAWVDADRTGQDELADIFEARFRPEFRTAFDAWTATQPFTSADAPPSPFAMPDYRLASRDLAERLDREAAASAADVSTDIQRASNYVLTVVLYSVVLFFGGMSTKLRSRRLRVALGMAALLLMLGTLVWTATFPISVSV
ncbi:MAG TPA: hypothetical protein VFH10_18110 [Nocardioides sp.]|uniref:hypothetical protein n=1 Tax=Nocardioides sp. TaxID=35761 RepID=UPI002D80C34E|nr:hypothetical protein [Nocardioides sp.]HET6654558.1 hypothetical protein [Nocardioides sp.]